MARRSYPIDKDLLKETRLSLGLTQLQLGVLSGYSERVIRKAERQGHASGVTIEDLIDTLA